MESDNLKTASLYINNQLLSRGLLRNGQTIDFARPENGEGGTATTMGRIMSVINDLILRRDRDATQRESLSTTIRALRADSLRQTTDIERLSTKNTESARKLGIAEASERALKLQIRSAEQAAKGLKEEMAKMKVLVQQTRAQCANEVRKREKVIEGLKRHVGEGGRARGSGKAVGVITVNVVPGVGEEREKNAVSVQEEGYDLRSETNEFLTELARGLSAENENISGLLQRTVATLRTLSGCEKVDEQEGGVVVNFDGAYENISGEMEEVIEHLRTLLTNPSFVPIEEVEVREEEIIRLREGWEKMESRWKEAVQMMDGWRRRMARSGQTVNLEELKMGLLLSPLKSNEDIQAEHRMQLSTLMEEGEGDTQADIDAMSDEEQEYDDQPPPDPADFMEEEADFDESESSLFEDYPAERVAPQEEIVEEEGHTFNTVSSGSPGPAPQLSPLKETNGNASRLLYPNGPQKQDFTTIVEENTFDLLELASSPQKSARPAKSTPKTSSSKTQTSQLSVDPEDEVSLLKTSATSQTNSQPSRSRSASPHKSSAPTTKPTSRPTQHQYQQPTPTSSTSSSKPTSATSTRPLKSAHDAPISRPSKPTATPKLRTDASSRLPRPQNERNPPLPQQSPLTMATIAAKLAATEREADAARVRAKLKAARLNKTKSTAPPLVVPVANEEGKTIKIVHSEELGDKEVVGERISGVDVRDAEEGGLEVEKSSRKRKAGRVQGGRANRRRSTLSPWEMESLILGGLGGASPSKEE